VAAAAVELYQLLVRLLCCAVLIGKRAKLMASNLSTHPLLAEFLQSNDNQYLSWLHNIQLNNYRQVSVTSKFLLNDVRLVMLNKDVLVLLI